MGKDKKKQKINKSEEKTKKRRYGNGLEAIWRYVEDKSLWRIFTISAVTLTIIMIVVIIGANKQGISHNEMEDEYEKNEKQQEGHLGGNIKLILDSYKNNVEVRNFNGEVENKDEVYVYFYSDYCPYCAEVGGTIVEQLENQEVEFITVNVNREKEFQEKEKAKPVPKIVRYEEGKRDKELVGKKKEKEYKDFIKESSISEDK